MGGVSPSVTPGRAVAVALLVLVLAACGSGDESASPEPTSDPSPAATTSPSPAPSGTTPTRLPSPRPTDRPMVGATPPPWLGTRVLPRQDTGFGEVRPTPSELERRRFTLPDRLDALPGTGFAADVQSPAPESVLARSTWAPECPVGRADLSWVRVAFVGFDGERHTGELLVNRSVAEDLVTVFRALYEARFPLEEMRVTRAAELTAPPTGDGNNTGSFACRATRGASTYSQHAYGLAVDVNPFQNPYRKGDVVLPELASSYLDRDRERPGMIAPDGPVVRAFARIGWGWGGDWSSLKDYQHFSQNGR